MNSHSSSMRASDSLSLSFELVSNNLPQWEHTVKLLSTSPPLNLADEDNYLSEGIHDIHPRPLNTIRVISPLGRGSFGDVYLIRHIFFDGMSALKVVAKRPVKSSGGARLFMRELRTLRKVSGHPFVVSLEASFHDTLNFYMITAFYPGGDLGTILTASGRFSHQRTWFYLAQIALAVEHLHSCKIIHRDIKPANIFVDACGNAVLGDFGLAKDLAVDTSEQQGSRGLFFTTGVAGTYAYTAPEVLDNKPYTFAVDIWSLGVTAFEMRSGRRPFTASSSIYSGTRSVICNIDRSRELDIYPDDHFGITMEGLLSRMLTENPARRATWKEIKSHVYFVEMNWQKLLKGKMTPPYLILQGDTFINNWRTQQSFEFQVGDAYDADHDPYPSINYQAPVDLCSEDEPEYPSRFHQFISGSKLFRKISHINKATKPSSPDTRNLSNLLSIFSPIVTPSL